ncbi:MAG: hypothetical protein JXA96_06490 [Sedimentisphaerales bacterium]|nr:hypothetical protein [Sedimentisphaerales bacterium]
MARRKRKNSRISLKKGFFKRGKNWDFDWIGPSLIKLLKFAFIAGLISGIGISLHYIDKKYIRTAQSKEFGPLTLKDVPQWVLDSDELIEKILDKAGGRKFRLDEKTASIVRDNLRSVAWMENTSVQTMGDEIQVRARYRKPIAVIQSEPSKFYIDVNQVVLDYVPLPKLFIVEIKLGSLLDSKTPIYGEVWQRNDLTAALKIIEKINQMDKTLRQKKPLLSEIASIDVSNYRGIKSRSNPHIILYSHDDTPIHWGAEIGGWQKEMESPDAQKLAKLYAYYEQEGTLNSGKKVNFINLRDPQVKIPLPIDGF